MTLISLLALAATLGPSASAPATIVADPAADTIYTAQESPGRASLTVRPRWVDGALLVDIAANTHSGDLSTIDLARAVSLEVGGKTIRAVAAGKLAGHHARATVRFDAPQRPTSFTIRIRGIPDVAVRTLQWPARSR